MGEVTPANSRVYYTDGSVNTDQNTAGAAFVSQDIRQGVRVMGTRCSMQAEGVAMGLALNHALDTHRQHVVIHTDSLTLIQALSKNTHTDNIRLLTSLLSQIGLLRQQGRLVVINWVPGHIGMQGNEAADREARAAAVQGHPEDAVGVFPSRVELLAIAKRTLKKRSLAHHKTLAVRTASARWYQKTTLYDKLSPPITLSRKEEVILYRLRLGYRCFWQLGTTDDEEEARCSHCAESRGHNLQHYVAECPVTRFLRPGPATTPEGVVCRLMRHLNSYSIKRLVDTPPPR